MEIDFLKENSLDLSLDFNKELIENPVSTFFGRVSGFSMVGAGVDDGDILLIDKSLDYREGALAVCVLNGGFTLKYVDLVNGKVFLVSANPDYDPIEVNDDDEFTLWGVVTYIVKKTYLDKI